MKGQKMIDILMHSFPTMEDPKAVEVKYCELLNAKRRGEELPIEAIDWMDTANNWLMESK